MALLNYNFVLNCLFILMSMYRRSHFLMAMKDMNTDIKNLHCLFQMVMRGSSAAKMAHYPDSLHNVVLCRHFAFSDFSCCFVNSVTINF